MKNVGFLNLPGWKNQLQEILVRMGREDLLKLPLLGRENSDNAWSAFDQDEFFSLVHTGVSFNGNPVRSLPQKVITNDATLAINRIKNGLEADTYYSAAIGGTFPFLNMLCDYCISKPVKIFVQNDAFAGFVLSTMEKESSSFEEAICDARWKDLTDDNSNLSLHGIVSRNRLVLQIAEIFGCFIEPEQISCVGINNISKLDIDIAKNQGNSIRLLGIAEYDGSSLKAITEPCLIPERYFLAQTRGGSEIIYAKTADGQSHVYACPGASAETVVRGIVRDIDQLGVNTKKKLVKAENIEELKSRFYVRFNIVNLTSTLAELLHAFEIAGVEIDEIYQPDVSYETTDGNLFIICTDYTTRTQLNKTLEAINKNIKLASLKACFRIIDRG